MAGVPRRALRQPRSLAREQLASVDAVTPAVPLPVQAWVQWDDGGDELVAGAAVAWTRRAVLVRWGVPPHVCEAWVWTGAVERREP
jgi:hypothetical protein